MKKLRMGNGKPEAKIQADIKKMLEQKAWFVKIMHGNMYQHGIPDLFATHAIHGYRWVEVKDPKRKSNCFTRAQLQDFPKFDKHGSGIWVLTAATDHEYKKLFRPPNWWEFLDGWRR